MKYPKFSIRSLLILTAVVAVVLYVLLIRPVALAKQFTHEIETSTDLESISRSHFDGIDTDGATIETDLQERTWTDIIKCRQAVTIGMVRPTPENKKRLLVIQHDYYSTPLGIQQCGAPCVELREIR